MFIRRRSGMIPGAWNSGGCLSGGIVQLPFLLSGMAAPDPIARKHVRSQHP
jgi:hypothetical protein